MKLFRIIIAAALISVALTACSESSKSATPDSATTPTAAESTAATAATRAAEVADCVRAAREENFNYTDKSKAAVNTTYIIPALTFETDDAKKINSEIEQLYADVFDASKKAAEAKTALPLYSLNYEASVNDDIVSLLIISEGQGHDLSYNVFNYNKTTGKRLDNEGLLDYLQRDYDHTFADLKKRLEADYNTKFSAERFPKDYYYQLENTVGDEALAKSRLFLNTEGELYAVCVEYASVGKGEFSVLIAV